jgi:anti-anti-sigma factor
MENAPDYSHIRLKDAHGITVVEVLEREIRHPGPAADFGFEVYGLVEREGHNRLLLDFTKNEYLCSTAFAVLVNLKKKVDEVGGQLKICGMSEEVLAGAHIIRLPELIEIYADERTALASF